MKKLAALMLTVFMVLGMFTFAAYADADISIGTYDELVAWAKNGSDDKGKTVVLTADIVANEGDAATFADSAPANVWTNKSFAGTFDGQGHSVSGLYMTGASKQGFIGDLSGTVKNLYVLNSAFLGTSSANGTICRAGGDAVVENVYSNAIVTSANTAGGIIGQLFGAVTVTSCWFDGTVTLTGSYASGIIGNQESNAATVTDCLNTGTITVDANKKVAGISTAVYDGKLFATRCVNLGNIYAGDEKKGCAICQTITSRDGKVGEAHLVDCFNLKNTSKTQPDDRRDKAVLEGEVTELPSLGNLGNFAPLAGNWAVYSHNGQKIVVPIYFGGEQPAEIPVYSVNEPVVCAFEVKSEGHWGPRWAVSLALPEGFTKDDVEIGLLVVPTKALPYGHELIFEETEYEYRGNVYPVAKAQGIKITERDDNVIEATFVITDLSVKTIRSNFTVRPYAVYKVSEGNIDIYGETASATFYTEAKLVEDEAQKAAVDAILAPFDAEIGGDFVVSRDWGVRDVFEEVPAMVVDNTVIVPAEDKGLGEYTIIVDGTEGEAVEYVELLQKCGFELKYSNVLTEGVTIDQLVKGDLMVTVNDIGYQNKTFVSAVYDQPLSPHLEDKEEWRADVIPGAKNVLTQRELYYWGDNYVVQLKNGHFIIVDGATDYELSYLLDFLEEMAPEGEKPVVEAWMNTHLHYDHFCVFRPFIKNPDWVDRVVVEAVYFNEPSDAVKGHPQESASHYASIQEQISGIRQAISMLHDSNGNTPVIYRPYIGQRYYFCDITVDIMLSQEMIPCDEYTGGFNDSSNFYMFTMDGQKFLEGGDGHRACMKFLMNAYDKEDIQCDFFSALHHGSNTWTDFTAWVGTFKTIVFPGSAGNAARAANQDLVAHAQEIYCAHDATVSFYLPYEIGKTGTDGGCVVRRFFEERYG
ncbi:MAG: MBL fold metallo-hydrolase [Clostridia bacterium]|nr:MBL fold metallo-hydrolase [Clostridia bacterium]